MLLAAALVFELARESLTGTHCRYREYVNGLPTDTWVTQPCPAVPPLLELRTEERRDGLRFVGGRVVRREFVEEGSHEIWQHDYDAASGALVARTPFFFHAKPARVFDPNPVVTLNDPSLQDLNDQAAHIPAAAYFDVEVDDRALSGPHATIVDRQPRNVPPARDPLVFNRADDGFEDVNAWFHIDRSQRYVRSLGFTNGRSIAPYAVEVDAHAATGEDNSYFVPSTTQPGRGVLFYGEGGTDDAEDADIVVHEYGHALLEWIAPGTWGGAFASEPRAIAEAVSDYWAFSAHYDARLKSGRDPFCFADWDARCWLDASSERCSYPPGSDCLRRLDSARTLADYDRNDSSGVEHLNSGILSSPLRELRVQLGRQVVDTLVLESLFGAPPRPTFEWFAQRIIAVNRILYRGANETTICAAMRSRGILSSCDVTPRGEIVHIQSPERGIAIPDNSETGIVSTLRVTDTRAIANVYVRVDIAHSANGDLRIELVAPDGTAVLLQDVSGSISPDLHVTYGRTATPAQSLDVLRGRSANGEWKLLVSDRTVRDAGTLISWGLDIQFAGEEPRTVRLRDARMQMIPVVAHLYGQSGLFASDVRIANPGTTPRTSTLVFAPSGGNGLEQFAAVQVAIAAGQTVAFDDVVSSAFHTGGSGSLEVLGDVVVMSRTYVDTGNGTLGQDVPANLETTSRDGVPLLVAPIAEEGARYNLGLTETAGARGIVRVAGRDVVIEPFGHVQFPVGPELQEVIVVEGGASVVAYISQVRSDDAMFIPALRAGIRQGIAPVITAQTSGTPLWRSDLWVSSAVSETVGVSLAGDGSASVQSPAVVEDVLARLFHRTVTAGAIVAGGNAFFATRIVHAETTQFVPFSPETAGLQQLLFIENGPDYRTNIGIVAREPVAAEVVVYDASGAERERFTLVATRGLAQASVGVPLTHGRAEVRFLGGSGSAFASLIDRRSGDATFVPGQ
jgi:subtilisin-like proprotein convertase family protein